LQQESWDFEQVAPLMSRPTATYLRQLRLAAYKMGKLALRPWLRALVAIAAGALIVAAAVALALFVDPALVAIVMAVVGLGYVATTRPARTPLARVALQPFRMTLVRLIDRAAASAGNPERLLEAGEGRRRVPLGASARPSLGPRVTTLLLVVTAFVAGSVPLALVLRQPSLLGYLAIVAALAGWIALRTFSPRRERAPMRTELALAWAAAIFPTAVLSLMSLAFYEAVRGVVELVGVLTRAAGGSLRPDADVVAVPAAIAFSLVFGVAFAASAAKGTAAKLYPAATPGRSVFYGFAATRSRIAAWGFIVGAAVFAAVVAGALLVDERLAWALEIYLIAATSTLWQRGATTTGRPDEHVVNAVSDLLTDAGFVVRREAASGHAGVDQLVRGVDLFARARERLLAIEVKTGSHSASPIDWTAASSLRIAASALAGSGPSTDGDAQPVEPVLILVGVDADESLEEFSRDVDVTLVRLPNAGSLDLGREGMPVPGRADLMRALGLSGAVHTGDDDGVR
jgi:hypothetical protein